MKKLILLAAAAMLSLWAIGACSSSSDDDAAAGGDSCDAEYDACVEECGGDDSMADDAADDDAMADDDAADDAADDAMRASYAQADTDAADDDMADDDMADDDMSCEDTCTHELHECEDAAAADDDDTTADDDDDMADDDDMTACEEVFDAAAADCTQPADSTINGDYGGMVTMAIDSEAGAGCAMFPDYSGPATGPSLFPMGGAVTVDATGAGTLAIPTSDGGVLPVTLFACGDDGLITLCNEPLANADDDYTDTLEVAGATAIAGPNAVSGGSVTIFHTLTSNAENSVVATCEYTLYFQ